jgi:hypothetical protein
MDLDSTGSPVPVTGCEEKDAIAQILRFLDVEVIVRLKCPEPVSEPLSNGLSALECSGFMKSAHDEDHILCVVAHCTREVPLVRSCEQVAHNLDVLLRHRPCSISLRGAAFHAKQ